MDNVRGLHRHGRRLDRQNAAIAIVIEAMRRGAVLHLQFGASPQWRLSTGQIVPQEIARLVTITVGVIEAGDALFENIPAQTFRFVE